MHRFRFILLLIAGWAGTGSWFTTTATSAPKQITKADFQKVVAGFAAKASIGPDELMTQSDVIPLVAALERAGMEFDRKEFLGRVIEDQSALVRLIRSPRGRKFIGQTAGNQLMFDRLDRLSTEPGGERMLRDLMKLPDAARYAKLDTGRGVPDMIDFLPKQRSSRTRRVKDYKKPTGKLYTLRHAVDYLAGKINAPKP